MGLFASYALSQLGRGFLVLALLVGSLNVNDLLSLFQPKVAQAAYAGKKMHTIEYVLGGGTDNTARGSTVLAYAGASTWNTTKATAGYKNIIIEGTGIKVRHAYLDLQFMASTTANVTALSVTIDVEKSSASSTDAQVGNAFAVTPYQSSGLTSYLRGQHDVTAFFDRQSDADWLEGVLVEAGVAATFSAQSNRLLTSLKLVITYEDDYSATTHNEVKTVRFPLTSTTVGDFGTRQAQCAAAATCSFQYMAYIPDAAANADILDVYFEVHAEVSSAVASTLTPQINGGTAGTAFNWQEALTDDTVVDLIYRPPVGGTDFTRTATQTLDIVNGAVAVNALGGELVVTYRYSTGATEQTETTRYFLNQYTAAPGITRNNFATTSISVSNSGRRARNYWYKIHTDVINTTNFTVFGKVATGTERSQVYALTPVNNPRAGDVPTIIFDLSRDATTSTSTTNFAGGVQFSAANGEPPAIEMYYTFTWNGSTGGTETQSVVYSGGQQGTILGASYWNNWPIWLYLSETVTKTYRSAYLEVVYNHSKVTSITPGTGTVGVNANTQTVTFTNDTKSEDYSPTMFYKIGTSTLASTTYQNTIPWTSRAIEVNISKSGADVGYFGTIAVLTYDADFSQSGIAANPRKTRTVEYLLGGGSDNNSRADNILAYAGASWNTTKGSAGTEAIVLEGTNIKVEQAYLEVSYLNDATAGNVINTGVLIDVGNSSSAGTDVQVGAELGNNSFANSGLGGFERTIHDVTALFDRQTDTDWSSGAVTVVAGVQVDMSVAGGSRRNTSVKLVLTYSQDYSNVAHYEVKTVRFPLNSTNGADEGTRQAQCAAAATCSFSYNAVMPEDANNSNIESVFFEIHAEVDSATASTLTPQINGGSAGTAFNWSETFTDDQTVDIYWSPAVGSPDFQRNTAQTLDIVNGSVPVNVLGGEVVVTYRYLSDATSQTETIRWFLGQASTSPVTNRFYMPTTTIQINNGGMVMKNVWYKVYTAPVNALASITLLGKVGTSTEQSQAYAYSGANPRIGNTPRIIFDLTAKIAHAYATTTDVTNAIQFSAAGGGAPATEAFFTFTWNGKQGGPITQTLAYGAMQQGSSATANIWADRSVEVAFPESVPKLYRNAYLVTDFHHSQAANITIGRLSSALNGGANIGTTTVNELADATSESYVPTYLSLIGTTTVATSSTINTTRKAFEVNQFQTTANTALFSNTMVFTYTVYHPYLASRYTQNNYIFYVNNNALKPTDGWPVGTSNLPENSDITASDSPPLKNEAVRLRLDLTIASTTVASSSQDFKLQFSPKVSSCGAIATSSWVDVGASNSSALWRGTTTAVTNGAPLSTNPQTPADVLVSVTNRAGTYQSAGTTTFNPWPYLETENIEYDWNIAPNTNVASNTPYCFRMIKSNGDAFNGYTYYPVINTPGYVAKSKNWRWYDDENHETPSTALAAENIAPVNVGYNNVVKLRMTLRDMNNENGNNQKFYLQFSETSDFSSGVYNLVASSSCGEGSSLWCYADGTDVDGDLVSTRVLTDSDATGTHNEAPTTTSTFAPRAASSTEFEFTLRNAGAAPNTVYFFRAYDYRNSRPVLPDAGESYPSLSSEGASMTLTWGGLNNGSTTEGITTTGTTTATTIPFGSLAVNATSTLAQRITVTTDAPRGYTVYVKSSQGVMNQVGNLIPAVTGTNASPTGWLTGCSTSAKGCVGYHAGDDTLEGSSRFLVDDTWAALDATAREIIYSPGPVQNDVNDQVYRIFVRPNQEAGTYSTTITYLIIPTF